MTNHKTCEREILWPISKYYPGIRLEKLKRTEETHTGQSTGARVKRYKSKNYNRIMIATLQFILLVI
jgi:hypothetical protein